MFFFSKKKKEFLGQDCLNMNVWFVFFFYFLRYLFDEPPVGDCTSVVFGSDMKVNICNNGPVTIIIDTKNKE